MLGRRLARNGNGIERNAHNNNENNNTRYTYVNRCSGVYSNTYHSGNCNNNVKGYNYFGAPVEVNDAYDFVECPNIDNYSTYFDCAKHNGVSYLISIISSGCYQDYVIVRTNLSLGWVTNS